MKHYQWTHVKDKIESHKSGVIIYKNPHNIAWDFCIFRGSNISQLHIWMQTSKYLHGHIEFEAGPFMGSKYNSSTE
jgi:hypothetical protein